MPDSLDIENPAALVEYLRATGRIGPAETPSLVTLSGGVSNRAVLLQRPSGESWVLKQALHQLRVKVAWFSDPRRIQREAIGMRRLGELAPPGTIPALIFLDSQQHLLAMEAVPHPHENWKTMLLSGGLELDHVRQFARLLGTIHRKGWDRRETLSREFDDRSFFESLRLEPYYFYAAEQVPAARQFLHDLVGQTRATRYTLVHGDYSPKNVLVRGGKLVLLDHEVIHFGDGAFDLGFSLTHLLSKARHLSVHRSAFVAAAQCYWEEYSAQIGDMPWRDNLEPRAVRHTLACLLARCVGRSPLEYLSEDDRQRQAQTVLNMLQSPPRSISQLVEGLFRERT